MEVEDRIHPSASVTWRDLIPEYMLKLPTIEWWEVDDAPRNNSYQPVVDSAGGYVMEQYLLPGYKPKILMWNKLAGSRPHPEYPETTEYLYIEHLILDSLGQPILTLKD